MAELELGFDEVALRKGDLGLTARDLGRACGRRAPLRRSTELRERSARPLEVATSGGQARQHRQHQPAALAVGPRRTRQRALELLDRARRSAAQREQHAQAGQGIPPEPVRLAESPLGSVEIPE